MNYTIQKVAEFKLGNMVNVQDVSISLAKSGYFITISKDDTFYNVQVYSQKTN